MLCIYLEYSFKIVPISQNYNSWLDSNSVTFSVSINFLVQFRQQEHKLACWANYSDSSSSSTATASAGRMDGRGSIYQRSTFTKLEFGTKITEFDLCLIISRYLKNITDDMYLLVGTYVNVRE